VKTAHEPTDAEILAAVPSDPSAFIHIFERHFSAIHRYVARQLGAEADDVTAEVFIRALRGAASFRAGELGARPWLFGIAAHVVSAELRRRYLRRTEALDSLPHPPHDHLAERRLNAAGSLVDVQRAVESLPIEQREPLLLFAWLDLTYEEIAAALALPVGTVRSRISRARKHLREALGLDHEEVIWDAT
jgi:RNA polymerase sigma factor (sigma-70 family)